MYKFGKADYLTIDEGDTREWVMANGIGGYVSGSIVNSGFRKHHGYLIFSKKAPVERFLALTRTTEAFVINEKKYDFKAQQYDTKADLGFNYLDSFTFDSTPNFLYRVADIKMEKEIAPDYGHNTVAITYKIENGMDDAKFIITPMFNYRDHGEISLFTDLNFKVKNSTDTIFLKPQKDENIEIKLYTSSGVIIDKYEKFSTNHSYAFEIITGDKRLDNHFEPKQIVIELKPFEKKELYILCTVEDLPNKTGFQIVDEYKKRMNDLVINAELKDNFANKLVKAADVFITKRESTGLKTILAGLPWFTDWGRDTMIALQGLALVTKRYDDAKEILESFSKYEHHGLIPNMFPDNGEKPLYNTVDASLWYFYSAYKYVEYTADEKFIKEKIYPCLKKIIESYKAGTDFNIKMDKDYLIHAGSDLDQITWMDVRVNNIVVTPRHGKPVEINALWYNALMIMANFAKIFDDDYKYYENLAKNVQKSFKKFYNSEKKCLYDVIDPYDESIRPNQIWAVSLPFKVLDKKIAKEVFNTVYKHLYNVYGLRSLSYEDERFKPIYEGPLFKRDMAYHMGTTWAFPIGGFIDSLTYVNDYSEESVLEAERMLKEFETHLNNGCINGISEIFDGLYANQQRGCFTQAWSVGEVLRAYYENVLKYKNKF